MNPIQRFIILFLINVLCLACQKDPDPNRGGQFIKFFGSADQNLAYALKEAPDGSLVIAGSQNNFGETEKAYLIKTDPFGNRQWEFLFDPANDSSHFSARDVWVDESRVYFLGHQQFDSTNAPAHFFFLSIALDGDVQSVVAQTLGSLPVDPEKRFHLNRNPINDDFYLLANTDPDDQLKDSDMYLIRLNGTDSIVFERSYGLLARDDEVGTLLIDPISEDILWTGISRREGNASDMRVVRADAFGNLKFDFAFRENNAGQEKGSDIKAIDAGFIGLGTANVGGLDQIYLNLINDFGVPQWQEPNGPGLVIADNNPLFQQKNREGRSIFPVQDDLGGYIILGTIRDANSNDEANEQNQDIYLLRVDADANFLWSRNFGSNLFRDNNARIDQGMMIIQSSIDQGFVLLSNINFVNNQVIGLIKTDREGKVFSGL